MKTIAYLIPYFGKLPQNFQLWLDSCKENNTIDWIIVTDDVSEYKYPKNVKRIICSFEEIKKKIQKNFDFKIKVDSAWCLSLFKPAYGEIFRDLLKEYDFWGYCDVDLIWGNIRKFITDRILEEYEKIGFQGHSTIYKNNKENNARYKTILPNGINYKDVFSGKIKYSFDENGMEDIFNYLNIPQYKVTNFAHLSKYDYSFYLKYLPKEDDYKNKRQIFTWKNGTLLRKYIKDNQIEEDEYMYIHFFCRPMKFKCNELSKNKTYVIYPDKMIEYNKKIDIKFIKKHGKCNKIKYYVTSIIYNRKKLTPLRIYGNIERMLKYRAEKRKKNEN